MKEVTSKKAKGKKKNKRKNKKDLKRYWSVLYPEDYASLLVQSSKGE